MYESQVIVSNRDSVLLAIPFISMLFLTVFRLDHLIAMPSKNNSRQRRHACGVDEAGIPILCDPDGRQCPEARGRIHTSVSRAR
jgi:hypothetical protein